MKKAVPNYEGLRQILKRYLGSGWYSIEGNSICSWVWSGEKGEIEIPDGAVCIEIQFKSIYFELTGKAQNIKVFVDRKLYSKHQIKENWGTIRILCNENESILIETDVVRPFDCNRSDDLRRLGICIDGISLFYGDIPERAIISDLPYDLDRVSREFENLGYKPIDYVIDIRRFNEYKENANYYTHEYDNSVLFEKNLEHFISLSFSNLNVKSKILDVANNNFPFPRIAHKMFECKVWCNDLIFLPGSHNIEDWHTQIGGDACLS